MSDLVNAQLAPAWAQLADRDLQRESTMILILADVGVPTSGSPPSYQ
jgi:hypothetical protein